MNEFGPSAERYWDEEGPGSEKTQNIVLATLNQAGLTEQDLQRVGEHTPDNIPLEKPSGERIGTVTNVHYNTTRKALVAEVTTGYTYQDTDLWTEFTTDKSKIVKVVLSK